MSKCRKCPWNLYKYKNSLLKTYFSLIIEYGMYLKCLQKRVNLAALLVQNKPSAPIRRVENKVEFLERQFHSEKLSFVHKKETEHSFELCLSICVFYRRIFNLEMQNFSLENHHIMNARQPFCWWMTFTKVSNPFLPSPPKWLTWPLDVCGGVGYEWFYWFSLRIFSQTSLELEIFFPRYNRVRFFFSIIRHERYFFQCRMFFFPRNLFGCFFSSRNQPAGHFFLKSPITPSKVKWSAPKIHQTFGQLTDSDLSIISKGFWNNRGQKSQGERGGIRFYLPLFGKSVRSSICHNQIFSHG